MISSEWVSSMREWHMCCASSWSLSHIFVVIAVILDISDNLLTGTVPASYANLVNLQSFDVSGNAITGEISQGMCGLDDLSTFVTDCSVTCTCCSACV